MTFYLCYEHKRDDSYIATINASDEDAAIERAHVIVREEGATYAELRDTPSGRTQDAIAVWEIASK
jgi:hypothetical protein